MIILVGRPETKTWWRNFTTERGIDVLLRRRWLPMTARAVIGANDPETNSPLLDVCLEQARVLARRSPTPAKHA